MNNEVLLVGNPNAGKTTLFNFLTKSDEHTGNWSGVTVDKKEKEIFATNYKLVDLPGTYSLTNYSLEEQVTTQSVLYNESKIINIIDFNNLKRSLLLSLQLIEAGKDFIIILNPIKNKKLKININKLSSILKRNVVLFNDNKKLNRDIISCLSKKTNTQYVDNIDYFNNFSDVVEIVKEKAEKVKLAPLFCAIKSLEDDESLITKLALNNDEIYKINEYKKKNNISISSINKLRFEFIDKILDECLYENYSTIGYSKIDNLILNNFFSIVFFTLISFVVFYITFCSLGPYLSSLINYYSELLISLYLKLFFANNFSAFFLSFIFEGVLSGLITILQFLPQVSLLFIFLAALEESGYISKMAFIFEDIFSLIGLSGKSIFTFFMSLGCTTSAMLSARTAVNKEEQNKAIFLSPYFICTAKVPVLTIFIAAFFNGNFLYIILFYIISILVFIFVALLLKGKRKKSDVFSIIDMPNYNVISFKKVFNTTIKNALNFITKIGSVLLICLVLVWFLNNFDFGLRYVGNNTKLKSITIFIGELISPLLAPIGLNNPAIVASLLAGVVAKEVILTSIKLFNGCDGSELVSSLRDSSSIISFDGASAISFILFSLFYLPCISSIVVMRKEMGGKKTLKACLIQFAIAYLLSFLVYNFLKHTKLIYLMLCAFIFITIFAVSSRYYKKNNWCSICKKCKINCCKK